jgi:RNA polymerase sigma-70 factor (ECF subfamily)
MTFEDAVAGPFMELLAPGEVDWDAVYSEQLPRIYNYFRFRVRRQADVEDLTAQTFEKAWRARQQYRHDRAGFAQWLFGIAHNVAIDHLRGQREYVPIDGVEIVHEATPEDAATRESDIARLAQLTAHLPDRERELLALKYGAGLNNREIAKLSGLSESNVGTILHRVVEKLRSQWLGAAT